MSPALVYGCVAAISVCLDCFPVCDPLCVFLSVLLAGETDSKQELGSSKKFQDTIGVRVKTLQGRPPPFTHMEWLWLRLLEQIT